MLKKNLEQELNRTKLVLDYARQEIKEKDKEIERLHSIIKEAREYCRNDDNFQIITVEPYAHSMVKGIQRKLLEILDKAGDSNE